MRTHSSHASEMASSTENWSLPNGRDSKVMASVCLPSPSAGMSARTVTTARSGKPSGCAGVIWPGVRTRPSSIVRRSPLNGTSRPSTAIRTRPTNSASLKRFLMANSTPAGVFFRLPKV